MGSPKPEVTKRCNASDQLALRAKVAETYRATRNAAKTARMHGVSRAFVARWGKRHVQGNANLFRDAPRSGRPLIFAEENEDNLYKLVQDQANNLNSARQLRNRMHGEVTCSISTVRRTLIRMGCKYPVPIKRRRLTPSHRLKRHAFAKRFHSCGPWSKTVFTDSTYISVGVVGRKWVVQDDENIATYDKHPSQIHMYAGVSCYGRTDVMFVTGTTKQKPYTPKAKGVTAVEYSETVLPLFQKAVQDGYLFGTTNTSNWWFVQDGARPHTAALTKSILHREYGSKWIKDWPPNSADLNPIENVWAILKSMLANHNYNSIEEFKAAARKAWHEIPQKHIRACCGSVGRRLRLVAQAKGGHIQY